MSIYTSFLFLFLFLLVFILKFTHGLSSWSIPSEKWILMAILPLHFRIFVRLTTTKLILNKKSMQWKKLLYDDAINKYPALIDFFCPSDPRNMCLNILVFKFPHQIYIFVHKKPLPNKYGTFFPLEFELPSCYRKRV